MKKITVNHNTDESWIITILLLTAKIIIINIFVMYVIVY